MSILPNIWVIDTKIIINSILYKNDSYILEILDDLKFQINLMASHLNIYIITFLDDSLFAFSHDYINIFDFALWLRDDHNIIETYPIYSIVVSFISGIHFGNILYNPYPAYTPVSVQK